MSGSAINNCPVEVFNSDSESMLWRIDHSKKIVPAANINTKSVAANDDFTDFLQLIKTTVSIHITSGCCKTPYGATQA